MNRRGFLSSMLALGAAPAIVRADALMRVVPVETVIVSSLDWREGVQYESFSDIITQVLRSRSKELAYNIRKHNAILVRLKRVGPCARP